MTRHPRALSPPSIVLECDIPESPSGSFYHGQLHVLVKDSVLQPPTPLRHATELTSLLKDSPQPILFAFTDGGGDHRTTFLSVQLSWILLCWLRAAQRLAART